MSPVKTIVAARVPDESLTSVLRWVTTVAALPSNFTTVAAASSKIGYGLNHGDIVPWHLDLPLRRNKTRLPVAHAQNAAALDRQAEAAVSIGCGAAVAGVIDNGDLYILERTP